VERATWLLKYLFLYHPSVEVCIKTVVTTSHEGSTVCSAEQYSKIKCPLQQ